MNTSSFSTRHRFNNTLENTATGGGNNTSDGQSDQSESEEIAVLKDEIKELKGLLGMTGNNDGGKVLPVVPS